MCVYIYIYIYRYIHIHSDRQRLNGYLAQRVPSCLFFYVLFLPHLAKCLYQKAKQGYTSLQRGGGPASGSVNPIKSATHSP